MAEAETLLAPEQLADPTGAIAAEMADLAERLDWLRGVVCASIKDCLAECRGDLDACRECVRGHAQTVLQEHWRDLTGIEGELRTYLANALTGLCLTLQECGGTLPPVCGQLVPLPTLEVPVSRNGVVIAQDWPGTLPAGGVEVLPRPAAWWAVVRYNVRCDLTGTSRIVDDFSEIAGPIAPGDWMTPFLPLGRLNCREPIGPDRTCVGAWGPFGTETEARQWWQTNELAIRRIAEEPFCAPPPPLPKRWRCDNGQCVEDPAGPFASLAECQAACKVPPPPPPEKCPCVKVTCESAPAKSAELKCPT